jgi:hypothetical protein
LGGLGFGHGASFGATGNVVKDRGLTGLCVNVSIHSHVDLKPVRRQHRPGPDLLGLPAARQPDQRRQGADRPPEADDGGRDALRRDRQRRRDTPDSASAIPSAPAARGNSPMRRRSPLPCSARIRTTSPACGPSSPGRARPSAAAASRRRRSAPSTSRSTT